MVSGILTASSLGGRDYAKSTGEHLHRDGGAPGVFAIRPNWLIGVGVDRDLLALADELFRVFSTYIQHSLRGAGDRFEVLEIEDKDIQQAIIHAGKITGYGDARAAFAGVDHI